MSVEDLLALRDDVGRVLSKKTEQLTPRRIRRYKGRSSAMKGR
jgi:hypothetical protein